MKQLILFVLIFVFGASAYAFLNPYLLYLLGENKTEDTAEQKIEPVVEEVATSTVVVKEVKEEKKEVSIDETGGVHDGPFELLTAEGVEAGGTVEIIRSPEETLLQFKNVTAEHSNDTYIYFATAKDGEKYLNLGPAKLTDGVSVYGMPLDADLSSYKYILIFNIETKEAEFFAEL